MPYSWWSDDHSSPVSQRHVIVVLQTPWNGSVANAFLSSFQLFKQTEIPWNHWCQPRKETTTITIQLAETWFESHFHGIFPSICGAKLSAYFGTEMIETHEVYFFGYIVDESVEQNRIYSTMHRRFCDQLRKKCDSGRKISNKEKIFINLTDSSHIPWVFMSFTCSTNAALPESDS